ncbi:MAG: hypothetical protein QM743_04220 [Chitinophagaceae bacterium]
MLKSNETLLGPLNAVANLNLSGSIPSGPSLQELLLYPIEVRLQLIERLISGV